MSKSESCNGGVSTAPAAEESMVVRLSSLDNMLQLAGEVIIVSSNLNAITHQVREGAALSRHLTQDIKDLAITSTRISSDLHSLVSDVRTVDMTDLFARFKRLARDTSRRLGKAVRFEVEGQDVCIDKKLCERIYDPIAHQIRNAMAHGIEDQATRQRVGKDPVGRVQVRVRALENHTAIEVIDDGAGIDVEAVRRKVDADGWAGESGAAGLPDEELFEFLFQPGFSTAATTSGTSGRGVGMDVIRTVMNELGGETRIESVPGQGVTFTFMLPTVTAVNISDSLLVKARNTQFAFPINAVVATQAITQDQVTVTTGKGKSIMYLGRILPLFDLMEVLGEQPVGAVDEQYRVIILEYKNRRAAYTVSEFLSPQKVVISEFDAGLAVEGLLGTAILSGRRIGMVIDLPRLFALTFGDGECSRTGPATPVGMTTLREQFDHGAAPADAEVESTPTPDVPQAEDALGFDRPNNEFLQEVESMLAKLNRELLALEERREADLTDAVFRLMHSIKGNLTMYGADGPAAVTHKIETILEQARRGLIELSDEAFDVLFDGSAYLEEVLAAYLKNQPVPETPEKLSKGIASFETQGRSAAEETESDEDRTQIRLDATGEFYLSSRRREGAALYQATLDFDPHDQPRFLVAYLILRRIQGGADVIGTAPSTSDIEAGRCEGPLTVLFSPRDKRDDWLARLEENLRRYFGVSSFAAAPYA